MEETYSGFADVYDELMDNIPYDDWFDYLHGLLLEYGVKDGIVAELGCGTGSITERMSASGYEMIGIDNSPAMLEKANTKKNANKSSTLYLCQDMRNLELYGTVNAIISLCDSINYITDYDELVLMLSLCNNYLDTNGLIVFDFHTRHYYKDVIAAATIAESRDNISFIWDNYYDEDENINELCLSLFLKVDDDNELYKKHEELHIQRGYTLAEMLAAVKASGLTLVKAYDAFTKLPANEDCDRIYIIAREHTISGVKKEFSDVYHSKLMSR